MSGETPAVREALPVYEVEAPETEPVLEGYKQTDVGVLPEDWEVAKIGAFANILRGASPRPIDSPSWFDKKSNTGWLRISDATSAGKYLTETSQNLSAAGISNSRFVESGSLVMSICATVGRPVLTRKNVCIHDGFVVFNDLSVAKEYLYYVLSNIEKDWSKHGQTGSQMNLNTGLIDSTPIPLPPFSEQRAIAAALSDVDELISALDKLIVKKRAIKTATMQQLLTGKQRLPGFSGDWETRRLGDVFSFLSTANNPRSDLSEHEDIGYIHYGDLHATDSSSLDCSRAKIPHIARGKVKDIPLLEGGDLIMADASEDYEGVGKSVEVKNLNGRKLVAGLHTFLLRGDKELLADGFKGYLQYVPSVRSALVKLATGISVYGISKNNVRIIEVELPGVEEQAAIAIVLSDMDAEIEALEARREKTRQVKQGMMQELLTGRTRLV